MQNDLLKKAIEKKVTGSVVAWKANAYICRWSEAKDGRCSCEKTGRQYCAGVRTFGVSETCYRDSPKFNDEDKVSSPAIASPARIQGIIGHATRLSAENEEWAKVLMTFSGGEIACRDDEWCRLSLQDGRNPPEQSLDFQLIIAAQDIRFMIVTQMV